MDARIAVFFFAVSNILGGLALFGYLRERARVRRLLALLSTVRLVGRGYSLVTGFAAEDIEAGTMVAINSNGFVVAASGRESTVGRADGKIEAGEKIDLDPETGDVRARRL